MPTARKTLPKPKPRKKKQAYKKNTVVSVKLSNGINVVGLFQKQTASEIQLKHPVRIFDGAFRNSLQFKFTVYDIVSGSDQTTIRLSAVISVDKVTNPLMQRYYACCRVAVDETHEEIDEYIRNHLPTAELATTSTEGMYAAILKAMPTKGKAH